MGREKMGRLMLMTVTIILLATVAVEPASARRQESEESWDNLKKLRVGEEIQVVYQEEQYLNGRFLGFTPNGITVQWGQLNPREETVPRKDVIRVIASRPSARVKNVLAGLGGGALVGLGIVGQAAEYEEDTTVAAAAALIGGAIGAVVGGVAGALRTPDATIYEAHQPYVRLTPEAGQAPKASEDWPSSSGPLFGCPRCDERSTDHVGKP